MKKITILLILLIPTMCLGQKLTAGFKGGVNYTSLKGESSIGTSEVISNLSSFTVGGFINKKIGNIVSLQTELSFDRQKFEFKTKDGVMDYFERGRGNFLFMRIPIIVQASYGNKLQVYVNGGLSANFMLSNGDYTYTSIRVSNPLENTSPTNKSGSVESAFNRFSLGTVGSAGLFYHLTPSIGLLGEFRVNYDLTKTAKSNEKLAVELLSPVYDNPRFFSYSAQFGISYLIR